MLSVANADLRLRKPRTLLSTFAAACLFAISACEAGDSPFAEATESLELSVSEVTLDDGEMHLVTAGYALARSRPAPSGSIPRPT